MFFFFGCEPVIWAESVINSFHFGKIVRIGTKNCRLLTFMEVYAGEGIGSNRTKGDTLKFTEVFGTISETNVGNISQKAEVVRCRWERSCRVLLRGDAMGNFE